MDLIDQLLWGFLLSVLVAAAALWRGSLSRSGAAGAVVVGGLIFGLGGWLWGLLLALFFATSSLLSHFKESEKRAVAEKFDKGHRRDIGQVMANGGLGAMIAVMTLFWSGEGWFLFFVGIMATVTADTWATELGTLARQPPRLITNGRLVEVGTSGGVSLPGTIVSFAGGCLIGLTAGFFAPQLSPLGGGLLGGAAGLIGSLFDSLLGATVQQIYYCPTCQKETERKIHKCGSVTETQRGWAWMNNDLVNFLASMVGGAAALIFWLAAQTLL